MISFFGIQWYRCSRSSSHFVPNRIQQYNTVCMTNISDRVIIDIVMWFWWWPHKSGSETAATVNSLMVSLCSTANNFPIGRSVCGLQKKAPHSLFHSPSDGNSYWLCDPTMCCHLLKRHYSCIHLQSIKTNQSHKGVTSANQKSCVIPPWQSHNHRVGFDCVTVYSNRQIKLHSHYWCTSCLAACFLLLLVAPYGIWRVMIWRYFVLSDKEINKTASPLSLLRKTGFFHFGDLFCFTTRIKVWKQFHKQAGVYNIAMTS